MAINVISEKEPKAGTLGRAELYALAVGQVIGAGVITLIVPAIKMTGYSAWLAYLVAIIFGFVIISPAIFITSTLRLGGGYYSLICDLSGPKWAGVFAFIFLTQCVSLSLFGVAASEYFGDLIPAISSPMAKTVVGASLLTFFFIVNLMGVDIMAKVQKIMTWLLIACLFVFAVVGTTKIKLPIFDFSNKNFMPYGFMNFKDGKLTSGFFTAVLLFVYSCQGYVMNLAYGEDAKNARKDIPWSMLVTVPTLIVLYVGVAIAATGCLSIQEYGKSTSLVYAAKVIFPTALFFIFIIGGPIMALLTTLNSSFAYNSITIGQSCEDGWLPKQFGAKNSRGARKWALLFMYILGLIPILLRFNIQTITNQIQLLGAVMNFLYLFAYVNMPKKYPEAWEKASLHVPDGVFYTDIIFSIAFNLIVLWKSCLSINTSIVVVSLAAIAICFALGFMCAKKGNITIHTSVWAEEDSNVIEQNSI